MEINGGFRKNKRTHGSHGRARYEEASSQRKEWF